MESHNMHFTKESSVKCDRRTWAKEVLLPVCGLLGITLGLVLLFAAVVFPGKTLPPVIPPHLDDGEMVDPNPLRLAFMCVGLVVSLLLAGISIRKGEKGTHTPAIRKKTYLCIPKYVYEQELSSELQTMRTRKKWSA